MHAALCALKQGTVALKRLIVLETQSQAGKVALANRERALANGQSAMDDCIRADETAKEGLVASKSLFSPNSRASRKSLKHEKKSQQRKSIKNQGIIQNI